jgi:hypothetical protein
LNQSSQFYEWKIERAQEWLSKEKARQDERDSLHKCRAKIVGLHVELAELREKRQRLVEQQETITGKIMDWQGRLAKLTGEELYGELQRHAPTPPMSRNRCSILRIFRGQSSPKS